MKKRVFALILSLCVIISAFPAVSFASVVYVESGSIRYAVVTQDDLPDGVTLPNGVENAVEVAPSGDGTSSTYTGAITIPSTITVNETTYTVVGIGANAFREAKGLTSLTLPDGLLYIGQNSLLAAGINGKMTSLEIPASVEYIGSYLFTNSAANGSDYTAITELTFEEDSQLKKIATGAFTGAQLTSLALPEGLLSIGGSAFSGSKITDLTIPASVEELNAKAFSGFNGKVEIAENNPNYKIQDGILYSQTELMAVLEKQAQVTVPKGIVSIYGDSINQDSPFKGNTTLTDISFEDPDAKLVAYAFSGCSNLQTVTLPQNLTEIPKNAFFDCKKLKSIDLSGIETIGNNAFENCSALENVDLSRVSSIGEKAFSGCTSLESANISGEVNTISTRAFFGCTSLSTVIINEGTEIIEQIAFTNCRSITTMVLPSSLTNIGANSFANAFSTNSGANLVFLGDTPPTLDEKAFGSSGKPANLTVIYPVEAKDAYKDAGLITGTGAGESSNGYTLGLKDTSLVLSSSISFPVAVPDDMELSVESDDSGVVSVATNPDTNTITITGLKKGSATVTAQLKIGEVVVVEESCTVTVSSGGSSSSSEPSLGTPLPPASETEEPSASSGFESDTTSDFTVDGVYQFRITSLDGTAPVMTASNASFRVELASREGNDYFFKIYAQGAAGSAAVISVNGTALLTATVGGSVSGVISDTTHPFTVAQGGTYQFRLTASERPDFAAGSPSFTVEYAGQIGSDYFFKVRAIGKPGDGCGFYINREPAPVAVATIA